MVIEIRSRKCYDEFVKLGTNEAGVLDLPREYTHKKFKKGEKYGE